MTSTQKLKRRQVVSLLSAGGSLVWGLVTLWNCRIERADMQAAIQALADLAFKQTTP